MEKEFMTVQLNMCGDRELSPRQAPSGPDLVIHLITGINLMEKSVTEKQLRA